jgi:hypothetical protein
MRMIFGAIGGMKIGRGTELLGENLPQRQFFFDTFVRSPNFT